ncbi:MAG TPA: CHAT domain-containing protein, partial [Ginsengibacter sp.]
MQKENYLDNHLEQKDIFLSMLYYFQQRKKTDKLGQVYYKMITALQGWLLSGSRQLNSIITQQHDESLSKLYDQWIIVRKQYTTAIQLTVQKQKELQLNPDSLSQLSQQMEMTLISKLPSLQKNLKDAGAFPAAVSAKLKNNEAFINWVSFKYQSPQHLTDSTLYGAFILLPKDTTAHFIVLFEENELKRLLKYYHNGYGRGILKPASPVVNKNVDKALYQLIWKPLLPYINKSKIIYTILSGNLSKVSFVALADSTNKTLLQTTELHFLSNVDDLIKPSFHNKSAMHTISLFGGANFNGNNTTTTNEAFPYLQGTKDEVDSLLTLFTNKKWNVQVHTGLSASEENFKKYSGKNAPYILHIATHGFYTKDNSSTATDFPLLRSGFILSGANMFWETGRSAPLGTDDGIVTAQEVSDLNFEKTNLVTLSACETALGDVNNNEGVYGLQRAFKIAGAKNMLITLWEIPDEPTRELMTIFYKNVLHGNNYYEALRNAQIKMKIKYPDPLVWAGFQLIGQ